MPRISAFGMAGSSIARNDSISSRVKAAQPPEITSPGILECLKEILLVPRQPRGDIGKILRRVQAAHDRCAEFKIGIAVP